MSQRTRRHRGRHRDSLPTPVDLRKRQVASLRALAQEILDVVGRVGGDTRTEGDYAWLYTLALSPESRSGDPPTRGGETRRPTENAALDERKQAHRRACRSVVKDLQAAIPKLQDALSDVKKALTTCERRVGVTLDRVDAPGRQSSADYREALKAQRKRVASGGGGGAS